MKQTFLLSEFGVHNTMQNGRQARWSTSVCIRRQDHRKSKLSIAYLAKIGPCDSDGGSEYLGRETCLSRYTQYAPSWIRVYPAPMTDKIATSLWFRSLFDRRSPSAKRFARYTQYMNISCYQIGYLRFICLPKWPFDLGHYGVFTYHQRTRILDRRDDTQYSESIRQQLHVLTLLHIELNLTATIVINCCRQLNSCTILPPWFLTF